MDSISDHPTNSLLSQKEKKIVNQINTIERIGNEWINEQQTMLAGNMENDKASDLINDERIQDRIQVLGGFVNQLKSVLIEGKLAERATDAEISEFLSKITSSLKSKMELFDDIVKIKLNSNYPKITKRTYSRKASLILKGWLLEHFEHPYPTKSEISSLIDETGLKEKQILNWFINSRNKFKNRSMSDKPFKQMLAQRFEEVNCQKRKLIKQ